MLGGFYDQVEAQDRLFGRLGWLSPAAAVEKLSATLAGSDFHHHRHFIESAEHYRRALVNRTNSELVIHPVNDGGERYLAGESLWAQIREFRYEPLRLGEAGNSGRLRAHCWAGSPSPSLAFSLSCRRLQP